MVRLKQAEADQKVIEAEMFQFLNGTIKARRFIPDNRYSASVSIPKWYD